MPRSPVDKFVDVSMRQGTGEGAKRARSREVKFILGKRQGRPGCMRYAGPPTCPVLRFPRQKQRIEV